MFQQQWANAAKASAPGVGQKEQAFKTASGISQLDATTGYLGLLLEVSRREPPPRSPAHSAPSWSLALTVGMN